MTPVDQQRFPAQPATLSNGVPAAIRPLAETDGEALATFYAGLPAEATFFYSPHPLDREHALQNAANAASPTEVVLVLATPDGILGGYAWYRWRAGAATSTFGICLAPAYQGTGAGKQLMARLSEIARAVGPPVMALTVQKINPRAIALYTKMGFQIIRDQLRAGDGVPEYYMERRVGPSD